MENRGEYTHEEIHTQFEAWQSALEILSKKRGDLNILGTHQQIIFTGCGSTYYLALSAASLTQKLTGVTARGLPASELWLNPDSVLPRSSSNTGPVLLVAVSRSGETTETLKACERFKADKRGDVLTLSCYADAPLASKGDVNLVLPSGAERSVAQTRAFSTLYLACLLLAALWGGQDEYWEEAKRLPDAGRKVLRISFELTAELGRSQAFDRFYFLGSGERYGLACELSLKMKEMSLSHSEPFHFMEFRHGPKSMVTSSTLIIGLVSRSQASFENAVLSEMQNQGAHILILDEKAGKIPFQANLSEILTNLLYMPVGQMLAFERAQSKGLNPDLPKNLETVVRLEAVR